MHLPWALAEIYIWPKPVEKNINLHMHEFPELTNFVRRLRHLYSKAEQRLLNKISEMFGANLCYSQEKEKC